MNAKVGLAQIGRVLPALGRRIWPIARRQILLRFDAMENRLASIEHRVVKLEQDGMNRVMKLERAVEIAMQQQAKLLETYRDYVNLIESTPVALREFRRDINGLKLEIERQKASP